MGLHDTPSFIDFVLSKTGQKQLSFIGHSEGNAQVFAGASIKPELYEDKVNLFVALAPVASSHNITFERAQKSAPYWREI